MKQDPKVLVLGPGRATRGGITAVINSYHSHAFWNSWQCHWLETHSDRSSWQKLWYFTRSFLRYPFILHRYQILHIHFSEPMSAFRKLLFMVPAKLLGKRIILHFHSFSPETTTAGRFKSIYSWMFRHADQIVVLSDYWHEQVKKISGQTPLEVIYNPARLPSSGSRERLPFILFAGTLGKRKGYADLIRAFAVVSSRHPDWCLVLAGNGETAEAEALSRELNISERVKVMGWVSGSKKEDLFHTASVFCLPSYAEGFPMSVIEAMAYRIPVVSTPVGGIRDVFLEHEDMLLVAPGCVYELAAKLDMMIRYPVMRQKMADASFVKIREHFALDQVGDKLDRLYHRLGKKD